MIDGYVVGDAEVVAKLDRMGPKMRDGLVKGITRLTLTLHKRVKLNKLSGQVLNVRTGRLKQSIAQAVQVGEDKVVGLVSTPVRYAPPHEYGFEGTVTVREHLRMVKQAWGKPIEPRQVTVREHEANRNLPARSFLRSALKEMHSAGEIAAEMKAQMAEATK